MARLSRVVINRRALDEVTGGIADGLFDLARAIVRVAEANAPDAAPFGEGLVERGGAVAYVGRRRVHETRGPDGSTVKKPRREARLNPGEVMAVAGFGFPARFQELGTVHHRAQPFFTPAVNEVVPDAPLVLSRAMKRRLRGERDPRSAEISGRIADARAKRAAR